MTRTVFPFSQGISGHICLEARSAALSNEGFQPQFPSLLSDHHLRCSGRLEIRDAARFATYALMSAGANSALVSAVCAFVLAQSLKVLTHRRVGCLPAWVGCAFRQCSLTLSAPPHAE